MFRFLILLLTFICLIPLNNGAPVSDESQAKIIRYENENDGSGNYKFSYQTSNGITREETGRLVNPGQPDEHIEVEGFIEYTDAEGNLQTISYVADKNGYMVLEPSGVQVVQAAPVPPSVLASLLG